VTTDPKKPRKNAAKKPPPPAHKKRYDVNQQQGDAGEELVKGRLPSYWVKRKVSPDFGLDWHIEVFDPVPGSPKDAETRGEHFYIQVKSQAKTKIKQRTIYERGNVTKYRPAPKSGDAHLIPVVECDLEVGELMTVEAMGHAVPVLLCVADMGTETVYYVCLNDYISKVLLPNNPSYTTQQDVTVHIPAWNVLDPEDISFSYIQQLARRGKLYSVFNSFIYQQIELSHALDDTSIFIASDIDKARLNPDLVAMLDVFLSEMTKLDIWEPAGEGYWSPLKELGGRYASLFDRLPAMNDWGPLAEVERFAGDLQIAGNNSVNMGRMYEELVREWRLPTVLAGMMDDTPGSAYRPTMKAKPLSKAAAAKKAKGGTRSAATAPK